MAIVIDGNQAAAEIIRELTEEVATLKTKPCVAFVRVGHDPASVSYVNKKRATAGRVGITSRLQVYPETISQAELLAEIDKLNDDEAVHGILVQSPLPKGIREIEVFRHITPLKDVDGLGTINLGKIAQEDDSGFVSCTPAGILELLSRANIPLPGKHVVVVGRSLLVGKPFALLAMRRNATANATVTVCHSRTERLGDITRQADILIAAVGRPRFITADMVKPGAVVIDVGINRVPDSSKKTGYRLCGDVCFEETTAIASAITPVPGGVGPMTVAMLMKNTVKSYHLQSGVCCEA